ncbi:FAD-dependent oxidoreductase [Propioniciclava soli]|uniref:FAD-dependent oxidoreductase n=1 Tax=Propioniciclava soli TaxID=2775081 RepID=A0ABZ3C6N6_9ACTN
MSHRIVVVGHGMVAHRFVAELLAHGLPDVTLTVLGDEPEAAYNRILLPDVLPGHLDLAGLTLPAHPGVDARAGVRATAIDRGRRVVTDDAGGEHPFDTLVLATGAAPVFPTIEGLRDSAGQPMPDVTALRSWADAQHIRAAAAEGARVVVLGGGLLGIEAAVALRRAGCAVTVIHRGGAPLDRQFDALSGRVVAASLADHGVAVLTDCRIAGIERRWNHALKSIRLTDDRRIEADLIVVAIGVEPRIELAARAELAVRRGVLVDDLCRTDDPDIHAIGDCAQTGRGCQGLVGPGWEQARVVAHHLAEKIGGRARPRPTLGFDAGVVRLKADGVDAVTMGAFPVDEFALGAPRVLGFVDAAGRRRVRIAVADGVLVGATCVGDPQIAADLTVAFDSRMPVPADPAALLARPLAGAAPAASVLDLPDEAVICRCNAVPKQAIAAAVGGGAASVPEVAEVTRATTGCGSCTNDVCRLVEALGAAPSAPVTEKEGAFAVA